LDEPNLQEVVENCQTAVAVRHYFQGSKGPLSDDGGRPLSGLEEPAQR